MKMTQQSASSDVAKRARLSTVAERSAELARIEIVFERNLSASIPEGVFDTGGICMSSYTRGYRMELGMIGLGRMGANMTERLIQGGHRVVAHDIDPSAVSRVAALGATGAPSIEALVQQLKPPRAVWLMVPAGEIVDKTMSALVAFLQKDDIIIDGGNSNYKDSMRHAAALAPRGIHFVDSGTSGGIWGLREGYCLMIGGPKPAIDRLRPIFQSLAPAADKGWLHVGPSGAGHFVKMIHNGIEYGLMQAYAEGF